MANIVFDFKRSYRVMDYGRSSEYDGWYSSAQIGWSSIILLLDVQHARDGEVRRFLRKHQVDPSRVFTLVIIKKDSVRGDVRSIRRYLFEWIGDLREYDGFQKQTESQIRREIEKLYGNWLRRLFR